MSIKPELSAAQYAEVRALEMRDGAMQRAAAEVVAFPSLSRRTAIAYIEKQREITRANSKLSGFEHHEMLLRQDASVRCFGRLLYFLRFGKCPTDATAEESAVCERLGAEIAKSDVACLHGR